MGRRTSTTSATGTITAARDADGLVTSVDSTWPPIQLNYTRDGNGQLKAVSGPLPISYFRDALGRRSGSMVMPPDGPLAMQWYDAASRQWLTWNPPDLTTAMSVKQGRPPTHVTVSTPL